MSLLRSDEQVALNDLLVASETSVDHYRDTAELVLHSPVSKEMQAVANERQALVKQLEYAVRASGDLPSEPDADRESVEKLYHRVHAAVADDEIGDLLEQRLHGEHELARQVAMIREKQWAPQHDGLIAAIGRHAQHTIARLEALRKPNLI
jgi:hypothetical protein